jgi:hypothetical protein
MANAIATIASTVTPYAAEFTNTEDAGAITGGGQQINVLAALSLGLIGTASPSAAQIVTLTALSPLYAGLNQAFASDAAAQAYVDQNVDLIVYNTAALGASAALYNANMTLGAGVAGNFRINAATVKAGAETFTERVRVALRQSIVR